MSGAKPAVDPKLIGSIVGAVVVAIGGAGGGYYIRGTEPPPHAPTVPTERLATLEQWRAAQDALSQRDREERAQLAAAIRDSTETNGSLRDAVLVLTERIGVMATRQTDFEGRLKVLEGKRH